MKVDHEYNLQLLYEIFLIYIKIINVVMVQNFEVISEKFNIEFVLMKNMHRNGSLNI